VTDGYSAVVLNIELTLPVDCMDMTVESSIVRGKSEDGSVRREYDDVM
jgi:hypothetical protein